MNFESYPVFTLIVQVEDNGPGNLTDQATVTVNLNDMNEDPNVENQTFTVDENSTNGTTVGTVIATDPDIGQSLAYSIISGNTNSAFQINSSSGELTVDNGSALDFESTPVFSLTVQVMDNGQGNLIDQATITINLNDLNDDPNIENQTFTVDENAANGQQVGIVVATDPDNGQSLTYTIIQGNSNNAFQLDASSGELTVQTSSELNYESNSVFILLVEVEDNGQGNLTDQAIVTVNLNDVNENPIIDDQTFTLEENIENGQTVGDVVATRSGQWPESYLFYFIRKY